MFIQKIENSILITGIPDLNMNKLYLEFDFKESEILFKNFNINL
jgi:hypothetical protein